MVQQQERQGSESRPRLPELNQKFIEFEQCRLVRSSSSGAEEDQARRGHLAQALQKFVLWPSVMPSESREAISLKMEGRLRLGDPEEVTATRS
jgi:hypothetical protein